MLMNPLKRGSFTFIFQQEASFKYDVEMYMTQEFATVSVVLLFFSQDG